MDRRFGHVYRYHSRSDAHSVALCQEIVRDILEHCPVLRNQALRGDVACGINYEFTFPSGKKKTLDLAIGTAESPLPPAGGAAIRQGPIASLLIACEAKTVMTEHPFGRLKGIAADHEAQSARRGGRDGDAPSSVAD